MAETPVCVYCKGTRTVKESDGDEGYYDIECPMCAPDADPLFTRLEKVGPGNQGSLSKLVDELKQKFPAPQVVGLMVDCPLPLLPEIPFEGFRPGSLPIYFTTPFPSHGSKSLMWEILKSRFPTPGLPRTVFGLDEVSHISPDAWTRLVQLSLEEEMRMLAMEGRKPRQVLGENVEAGNRVPEKWRDGESVGIRMLSTDHGIAWYRLPDKRGERKLEIYECGNGLPEATKLAVGMVKYLEPGSWATVIRRDGSPVAMYR